MTFEVGRLSAALTLDGVPEFHQGLDAAGRKLTETGNKGASFGKLGEQAIRSAAGATTGLVTAAGAYLTILTKQGVAYNSMQQNSRAALKVLLGGTEAANVQMSKLDDFARNSPFSKAVFIQAQQQLIGFGMEAGKVVPTLDAIQQGVAAMGGSNEQISEVVNILAKVQSTGKFTAETLNELGYRGVDAATLMGDAMGKSAAQMRDDISKGAIGGAEAIDVLVDAMQNRFGGAADGVKEQWSGAVDRIKAAQRDLGAHIAEPFISAQGGGMAVTWGNQVADVLRAIEKQAVPVMGILTQRGMPFFSALTQGLDSAAQATARWDADSLNVTLDKMSNHAPGIAALAGATLALGTQVGPLGKMFSVLGFSANPVLAAFVGLAAASPEVRDSLMGIVRAGEPLLPVVADLAGILSGTLNAALPVVAGGLDVVATVLETVFGIISKIPTPVLAGAAAFLGLHAATKSLNAPLSTVLGLLQQFGQKAAVQAALGETSLGMGAIATASMEAKTGVSNLGTAMKTAFLSNPIGIALTVVATAVGAWAMANASAQQKVQEHNDRVAALKNTLNETSGAITDATAAQVESNLADTKAQELAEKIGVKYKDVQEAVLGNEEAYARVTAAVDEYSASMTTGDANADTWNKTFMDGQGNVRDFTAILEDHRAAVDAAQQAKQSAIQADREAAAAMTDAARSNQLFNDALEVARDITQDAETRVRALKQALDELAGGSISTEEAEKKLSETNLSLAEGLALAGQEGEKLWQNTLDGAGNIDLASRSGLAFANTMGQSRDAMLNAAMAAADQALANGDLAGAVEAAKSAGDGYVETLRNTMAESGLTQEQIDGLIGKYLDVPSTVATLLTDNGSISEVDQKLITLAAQIDATPDKTVTITEPMSPTILKRLEDLGYKVENLPDGNIKVTETGASTVENTLNQIARERTATITVRTLESDGVPFKPTNPMLKHAVGGMYSGGQPVAFAQGGFASGFYKAPPGMPAIHKFAENFLSWEAYISPLPGAEERNARIAMEALDRLGHPVIPVSALRGVPAFAAGAMTGSSPMSTPAKQKTVESRRNTGPLVGNLYLGGGATKSEFDELERRLDFINRGGR